jgi:hypothetical protein
MLHRLSLTANFDVARYQCCAKGFNVIHAVVLNHVTKGHDDWNTDVTRVYVRN